MLRMWWKNDLRRGWRGVLLLLLMVGLGGGIALTALAGARRADTAMPRFLSYSEPGTGAVFFGDRELLGKVRDALKAEGEAGGD